MIEIQNLSKRFTQGRGKKARSVQAVADVSFKAEDGRITGLLGPNGAGKTTTLRMAAALIVPDAGRISVDGIDVAQAPQKALARMGVLSDARGLYPRLTARENIVYYGRLHGMAADAASARAEALAEMLEMKPLLDRRTEGFSQGERMKTALARAIIHDPPNLVLDEPTNGLDIPSKAQFRKIVASALGDDRCVVISTHQVRDLEALIDTVVVLHGRRIVLNATLDDLAERLRFGPARTAETAETAAPLYAEPSVRGPLGIWPNPDGQPSRVDLELLFNALTGPDATLFHYLTQPTHEPAL